MERLARAQLKFLGIGVEIVLEIRNRHAVRMLIIYTQSATYIDVLHDNAVLLQQILQFGDAIAECLEVAHIEYLTTDVEMKSYNLDMLHGLSFLDDTQHVAHGNTKLILSQSCSDVGMSMGTDVGVETECHTGRLAPLGCQFVDNLQFGNAFDIEAEYVVVETEIDFPVALADTGINNLCCRKTGAQRGFYLTTADTVGAKSCLADSAQYLRVGIGLDGIVNHKALMLSGFGIDSLQRLSQQFRIVIVERCLQLLEFIDRKYSFCHCVVLLLCYLLNNVLLKLWRARFLSSSRMRNEML